MRKTIFFVAKLHVISMVDESVLNAFEEAFEID